MSTKRFPILEKYGSLLNELASHGKIDLDQKVIDETILTRIMQTISRIHKNNPILISDSKMLIQSYIDALTLKIVKQVEDVPDRIADIQIYKLNLIDNNDEAVEILAELLPFLPRGEDYKHEAVVYLEHSGQVLESNAELANLIYKGISQGVLDCILGMTPDQYESLIRLTYPTNRKTQPIQLNDIANLKSTSE